MTTRIQQFPFGVGGVGGLDNVVEDLTPELGGDLLTNGFAIRGSDPSGADSGDLTLQTAGPDSTFNSGKVRIGSGFVSGGGVAGDTEFVHGNGVFFRHTKNGVFGILQGEGARGPAMINTTPSATVPTLLQDKSDITNGVGGVAGATTLIAGSADRLTVNGTGLGFFATGPVAQQIAVPVTAAGVHAALVAYGLIT